MNAHDTLTLQMLQWIHQQPHSYAEVLDVWRTSCPRFAIWEDACADGLIACAPGRDGVVSVTAKGRQMMTASA